MYSAVKVSSAVTAEDCFWLNEGICLFSVVWARASPSYLLFCADADTSVSGEWESEEAGFHTTLCATDSSIFGRGSYDQKQNGELTDEGVLFGATEPVCKRERQLLCFPCFSHFGFTVCSMADGSLVCG